MTKTKRETKEKNTGEKTGYKASGGNRDYAAIIATVAAVAAITFFLVFVVSWLQPIQPNAANQANNELNAYYEANASSAAGTTNNELNSLTPDPNEPETTIKIMDVVASSENAVGMLTSNASTNSLFINASSLNELAKQRAAIYGGLGAEAERNGVFEVQLSSGNRGLILLIGVDDNGEPTRVLRELFVGSLVLGETQN